MSEETTTTETAAEAVEFGAERVESARAIVEAERVMPADFAHNAALHFAKAVRKHPRFADKMFGNYSYDEAKDDLDYVRRMLCEDERKGRLMAEALLLCETAEAEVAYHSGDASACVDELYDAVAVLMRMIAVVEGKQKLGGAE